jgi:hypothetical protein
VVPSCTEVEFRVKEGLSSVEFRVRDDGGFPDSAVGTAISHRNETNLWGLDSLLVLFQYCQVPWCKAHTAALRDGVAGE